MPKILKTDQGRIDVGDKPVIWVNAGNMPDQADPLLVDGVTVTRQAGAQELWVRATKNKPKKKAETPEPKEDQNND
ncbi:MAG: hypothetical protein AAGF20_00110 [Pseudomonadota bacterium]